MLFNFSTPVLIRHLWQLKTVVFLDYALFNCQKKFYEIVSEWKSSRWGVTGFDHEGMILAIIITHCNYHLIDACGAMTLAITTFSITTLSITALSITTELRDTRDNNLKLWHGREKVAIFYRKRLVVNNKSSLLLKSFYTIFYNYN
jgi:hypothetical protein